MTGEVKVVEQAITGEGGDVLIRREVRGIENGATVTWMTGDKRYFKADKLPKAIEQLEFFGEYEGVWVQLEDSASNDFQARILDDDLQIHLCDREDDRTVPWEPLRETLLNAVS